jgi:hypothetical protein
MKSVHSISKPVLLALAVLFAATAPAFAKDKGEWTVKGDLVGKKGKVTEDLSGIACTTQTGFPRTCLIIDDELQAAQVVTLTDGKIKAGPMIPLIDDKFDGKAVELDGEGVAFADNYFYVIGSHGRPRHDKDATDQAKEDARVAVGLAASSKLVRLKFDPATGEIAPEPAVPPSTALAKLIAAEALFAPFKDKPLEEGGITIEGVAVLRDRLFAGFRGPVIGGSAVIMSVALGHLFDGQPPQTKQQQLKLGDGRGVRDLAAFDNGILILAGPVASVRGTYSIFRWDGSRDQAKLLADLPDYLSKEKKKKEQKQYKPEALLPLDRSTKGVRVLLLLDSAKQGKPRAVRIPYP